MVRCNKNIAPRYHKIVNRGSSRAESPVRPLMLNRARQAIGLQLGLDLRDIVPKHDNIVLFAVDIADVVAKQRLGLETQAFEQRDGGLLVDRHLHRELLQPGAQGQRKRLLGKRAPDAEPPDVERHHHADFPYVRRPGMRITYQGTATDHLAIPDRQQARDVAALDLVDPGRQHFWLADISRQEQEIMGWQLLCEGQHRGFVGARHQAKFDFAGFRLDTTRIGTVFTHIDLPASQLSSFGHSRRTALAPATSETWPPLSITSSLSLEATRGIRCFADS